MQFVQILIQKLPELALHCTGFKAISRFAEEFPDAFVLNSAGTCLIL
jgi:metal-dependent hydrolase (beta-lactamase superfamily II)